MRKQYHFRQGAQGLLAWDVDRLVSAAAGAAEEQIALSDVRELDSDYWFGHGAVPTVRAVVEHLRLVAEADLSFPIVVDPDGQVMDGMHRVAKALLEGRSVISARRLPSLPAPDHVDVRPDDLPYDQV